MVGPIGKELRSPGKLDSYATVWGKLYDAGLVKDSEISFVDLKEIGSAEDTLFNIEVFNNVIRAAYCDKCFYHYRKGSGMTSKYNKDLPLLRRNFFEKIRSIVENKDSVYKEALDNRIALSITGLGLNILCNNSNYNRQIKDLQDIISIHPYSLSIDNISVSDMPFHWKYYYNSAKKRKLRICFLLLVVIKKIINSKNKNND